jgi:hypothetical protein
MINKTALVLDSGMCQSLAHRLALEYERVLYCFRSADFAPDVSSLKVGTGYDDIERVQDWEDYKDQVDTWIFPYIYSGPLQDMLRREGRAVWGAGGKGERMETDRWEMIELMQAVGLPVPESHRLIGISALRKFLKANDDFVVKVSYVRGLTETFTSPNYNVIRLKLLEIEHDLGAAAEEQEFIVQKKIKKKREIGYDGYNIRGLFPKLAQWGVESKDEAYASTMVEYDKLPEGVRFINDKLAPAMKSFEYGGFFYTEAIEDDEDVPHLIDTTCRMGSPSGECWMEHVKNVGKVIEGGANGKLVEQEKSSNFAVQVTLRSDFVRKNWLELMIPADVRPWIKLVTSYRKTKKIEAVTPQEDYDNIIGCAVGVGDTLEEAREMCIEHAQQVVGNGFQVGFEEQELDNAIKILEEGL